MIDYDTYSKIKAYHNERGLTVPQIAGELGLDPRTVQDWVDAPRFRQRQVTVRPSKLDPFKNTVLRMLENHASYTATQLFQRLREDGYDGGYSILKEYVRTVRPKRAPAFLTLAFAPGECAQVDWGEYGTIPVGGTNRRLSFFLMVLCHSRMMYLEFTVSQTMEHFLAGHQNAFVFFGGVPARIMVDNLKSAVLHRLFGKEPVLNPKYLDFANHYGFTISPCNVRKGNEKGRVENGVGYVKKNFLNGLNPSEFQLINPAAKIWLDTIANVRIHGETKRKPVELFLEEKPSLQTVATMPYDLATIVPVLASSRFRITYETNRYSVPAEFASARLILKAYPDRICIYHQDKLIARHTRRFDRHQDIEDPDHPKELIAQRRHAAHQKILLRFLALSPMAQEYYRKLEEKRVNPQQHIARIVALSEIYDTDKVAQAIADACHFQAFSSEYIANILEQRAKPLPELGALHLIRRQDLLDLEMPPPDLSIYD